MARSNVYVRNEIAPGEVEWERVGSFDPATAVVEIDENRRWNGSDLTGVHAGQWEHETLYRTRRGRWILLHWSQRAGSRPRYMLISDAEALEWLRVDESDEANAIIARYWPGDDDDVDVRGPGRPEVGPQISVRIPEDVLGVLDTLAEQRGLTRSELVRQLIADALATATGGV